MDFKNIKLSLTKKVALLFTTLTLILIMLISISFFVYFRGTIKQSLTNALDLVINNNADNLDKLFSRIELVIDIIESEDSSFVKYLMEYNNDMVIDVQRYQQFENEVKKNLDISLTSVVPYYGATFFVDDTIPMSKLFPNSYQGIFTNQNYYYTTPVLCNSHDAKNEEWYKKTLEKNGDLYWFKSKGNENVLYMSKMLYTYFESDSDFKKLGIFMIGIDVSLLTKNFDMSKMTYGTVIVLSDQSDNVVYSNLSSLEGQNVSTIVSSNGSESINEGAKEVFIGSNKVLAHKKELHGGLNITTFVPINDINKIVNGQFVILIILTFIMMLVGILIVIYISRIIVRPIAKLSQHMKLNDDFETISCAGVGKDEIGIIYQNYNNLIQQIYEKTEKEKETRLKMLQAQINPHFIYNTLDSICCISLMRKQEDVADILSRLANLIRYNIKDPDAMIPVKKELEQIYDYVQIQKFRDGNKIEVTTNADSTIENILIPKMIIQPLVENSFFYGGVNLKSDTLKIDISFSTDNDILTIRVRNNGCCEDVDRINKHLKGIINISKSNGGFGIRNVEQRIQMKFGSNYCLNYESEVNGDIVAVITIPKIQK